MKTVPEKIGPYRVEDRLGAGGMGEVYRGRHERLGRRVALKQIRPEAAQKERSRQRFLREARAAASLNHPSIVQVYDIIDDGGCDWIVMELVEGQSLARLLTAGPLPPDRLLPIAHQLAAGLEAAHARGIVHRDLKSHNVVVTPTGHAKILDFGLAKQLERDETDVPVALETDVPVALETRPPGTPGAMSPPIDVALSLEGQILGTPGAMSPEQAAGRQVDFRSDLFSLGSLLYEAATGTPPFAVSDGLETLMRICTHQPAAACELVPEVPRALSDLIAQLLEKDVAHRPQSAADVLSALQRITDSLDLRETAADLGRPAGHETTDETAIATLVVDGPVGLSEDVPASRQRAALRLRSWPPPEFPGRPYPLLLPYAHPALLAGRDRELNKLRRSLRLPSPILGLHAPSGAGKSSLLSAGVVPMLRAEGQPVAFERYPQDPGLAGRLAGDLLQSEGAGDAAFAHLDDVESGRGARAFIDLLHEAQRLSGKIPVLVVDQFDDLLRGADYGPSRAVLGVLLAASVKRRPGFDAAPCRWLLAYRQELHGEAMAWLGDVLYEAEAEGFSGLNTLPHDLSGADRFHSWPLLPLGTPSPGSDGLSEATRIFQVAIEAPLELTTHDGRPRYPWRFAAGGTARLARAFAEARLARPEVPLTPELQVVLAHLLAPAGSPASAGPQPLPGPGAGDDALPVVIHVPDEPGRLIDEALEDHLRRVLEEAFPAARSGSRQGRARALLALRELADAVGHRGEGLPAETLTRMIGAGGAEILDKLATPRTRLVVTRKHPEGWRYVLAHDRLAEVVVRMVEKEGRSGQLNVDTELLALRRFVALHSALFSANPKQATLVSRGHYLQIDAHADALLLSEDRREWWAACRQRRRADRRRTTRRAAWMTLAVALVAVAAWLWVRHRETRRALLDQIATAEPGAALEVLGRVLADDSRFEPDEVLDSLRQRTSPMDLLERGLDPGAGEEERHATVMEVVRLALPLVDELQGSDKELVLIADMTWALDFFPARDPRLAGEAQRLRDRVLEPLRRRRPPPPPPGSEDPDWVPVLTGTFRMGSGEGSNATGSANERPRHRVTVSAFRMLDHEVTHAEYRRLVPGTPGDDDVPIYRADWYEAYAYAAWLGGRLPTEAEWEYAARAGCPHDYCTRSGDETTIHQVGWTRSNAFDPVSYDLFVHPVRQLESNPWGLFDLYGNVTEWVADWYDGYSAAPQQDPFGPVSGTHRTTRGGSCWNPIELAQAAYRSPYPPDGDNIGFRIVLPSANISP